MNTYNSMNFRTLRAMAQVLADQGFTTSVTWSEAASAGYLSTNGSRHDITGAWRAARAA